MSLLSERIVDEIIADLYYRHSLNIKLGDKDDDVRDEIRQEWIDIVDRELEFEFFSGEDE